MTSRRFGILLNVYFVVVFVGLLTCFAVDHLWLSPKQLVPGPRPVGAGADDMAASIRAEPPNDGAPQLMPKWA